VNARVLRLLASLLVVLFSLSACGSNPNGKGSRCFWCNQNPFGQQQRPEVDTGVAQSNVPPNVEKP
jgi:hypothetical protein